MMGDAADEAADDGGRGGDTGDHRERMQRIDQMRELDHAFARTVFAAFCGEDSGSVMSVSFDFGQAPIWDNAGASARVQASLPF